MERSHNTRYSCCVTVQLIVRMYPIITNMCLYEMDYCINGKVDGGYNKKTNALVYFRINHFVLFRAHTANTCRMSTQTEKQIADPDYTEDWLNCNSPQIWYELPSKKKLPSQYPKNMSVLKLQDISFVLLSWWIYWCWIISMKNDCIICHVTDPY